jgi:GNAT superfamily N-acetyltransferase
MKLKTLPLCDAPQYLSQVAKWYQANWGEIYPDRDIKTWEEYLSLNRDKLPITFIAVDVTDSNDESVVGTASLHIRPSILAELKNEVWLIGVYTNPKDRGKGVASELLKKCIQFSETHTLEMKPITEIMLLTYTSSKLYQKLGWENIGEFDVKGEKAMLMTRKIDSVL